MDFYPPKVQRPALEAFAVALDSRASALRRDDCGDWAIFGGNGHIYAVPGGFQLMVGCDFDNVKWASARGWESAKDRLALGKVTQDGDCGGSIILARLPTQAEAVQIRAILGIPKRRHLSEGHRELLIAAGSQTRIRPALPAKTPSGATMVAEATVSAS